MLKIVKFEEVKVYKPGVLILNLTDDWANPLKPDEQVPGPAGGFELNDIFTADPEAVSVLDMISFPNEFVRPKFSCESPTGNVTGFAGQMLLPTIKHELDKLKLTLEISKNFTHVKQLLSTFTLQVELGGRLEGRVIDWVPSFAVFVAKL